MVAPVPALRLWHAIAIQIVEIPSCRGLTEIRHQSPPSVLISLRPLYLHEIVPCKMHGLIWSKVIKSLHTCKRTRWRAQQQNKNWNILLNWWVTVWSISMENFCHVSRWVRHEEPKKDTFKVFHCIWYLL
jgi:hypothetical protein